jgi:hypothetical protein
MATTTMRQLLISMGLGDVAMQLGPIGDEGVPVEPGRPSPATTAVTAAVERATRWRSWGVPEKTVRLVAAQELLDTDATKAARELVVEVGNGGGGHGGRVWCALLGPVGCGKTVAAALWLTEVPSLVHGARMFVSSESVAALPPGTVWAEERIEALSKAPVIVLDDVGLNDGVDGRLHPACQRVLRARYDRRLPTMLTSNSLPRALRQYLGDARMADRWDEVSVFRGVDQRVRPGGNG